MTVTSCLLKRPNTVEITSIEWLVFPPCVQSYNAGPFSIVKIQCLLGIVMRSLVSNRIVTTKASWLDTPAGWFTCRHHRLGKNVGGLFPTRVMAIKRQGLQRWLSSSSICLASVRTGVWISQKPHKCWVCKHHTYYSKQKGGDSESPEEAGQQD